MRALLLLAAGCASSEYTRLYATADKPADWTWDEIGALERLGPTLVDRGVNFGVFAANATRVDLLLFDDPEAERPTQQLEMTRYDTVWNLYVEGVGPGQHYGYVAWGPNWEEDPRFHPGTMHGFRADVDEGGNRYDPNKLLIDPYAKVVHRDHDWGRGSAASGPYAEQSTYGAAAKSVVIESTYNWQDDAWIEARQRGEHHDWNEVVVYEVHVKGFSMAPGSNRHGVEHFGTFRGLGEGAAYLQDLGITAVELLPIHEKPADGGYWGYNNLSWFAPETTYSAAWHDGGGALTGSYDRYAAAGKKPYHVVNFVTAHDGFTLFDLFSYPQKENGCGPLNPICCVDACSAWCDPTSGESNNHSRDWAEGGDESLKRQMMRNAFVGLLLSNGTPMMLGGDEWMRTQYGNNNAYTTGSDNEWAWFRWSEWTSENRNNVFRHRMHDFVRDLLTLRREHASAFSPREWGSGMPITWLDEHGGPASGATWGSRHMQVFWDDAGGEPRIAMLINMEQGPTTFRIPGGVDWGVVVDTQAYYDRPGRSGEPTGWFDENPDADPFQSRNITLDDPTPVSGVYTVEPRSIVVLRETP